MQVRKVTKKRQIIPPPPKSTASWEEKANYFEKYSLDDLENAGHLLPLTAKDKRLFSEIKSATRRRIAETKRQQVNISLDIEDMERLEKAAKRQHFAPATLARSWLLQRLDQERL